MTTMAERGKWRSNWNLVDPSWMVRIALLLLLNSILVAFSTLADAFPIQPHSHSRYPRMSIDRHCPRRRENQSALAAAPIIDPIMLMLPEPAATASTIMMMTMNKFLMASSSSSSSLMLLSDTAATIEDPGTTAEMLSQKTAITVFVIGLIPWTIATYEFWRRIAVGEAFGTRDPVVFTATIGEEDNPVSSRGRQVLGPGALFTAYAIFTVVAAVLGLVLYSVMTTTTTTSTMTIPPPLG